MDRAKLGAMASVNDANSPDDGTRDALLGDRRRPERLATENPHLIALMRGGAEADCQAAASANDAPQRDTRTLVWVTIGSIAFWAAVALVLKFG